VHTPTNVRYWLAGSRPVPAHVGRELDLYKRLSIDERRLILEQRRAAQRGRPKGAGPGRPRRRPGPPSRGDLKRPDEES
jgi:hypothetical protein